MKNSNFFKNSIIALLPISFALGVIFVGKTDKPTSVNAYDYTTLSKMDINLNDTSSKEIRSYYSDLNDLTAENKKGTNLLKYLKPLLSEGQQYFSYDKGKDSIWRLYEITDRDWKKSGPTFGNNGTYDATTNVIKGYTFAAGKNDESKNPYIHALYIDRSIDNPVKAWGNHNQDGVGINQEHIWAKSHGFDTAPDSTTGGARGDPMHLWAGNGYANNIHSNYFYGYVDKEGSDLLDTNSKYPETVGHNFRGTSLTLGSGTVFEPQDSDKGDIARAMFYMVARYNNYAGDSKGIDGNEPNLILNNSINNRTGTSGPNDSFNLGVLSDLLEWNKIDPPDEYEIHRNNLLYTNFTHNRNPFIDFPDWADICFGNSTRSADPIHDKINGTSEEKQLVSISVTTLPDKTSYVENETFDPTGMVVKAQYDDGTSLPITGYTWSPNGKLTTSVKQVTISYGGQSTKVNITVKSSVIHPETITISPQLFELEVDSTRRLTATVLPSDTTNKAVTWSSSDKSVATVSSTGYVTAVGPGTATIKATTKDTGSSVYGIATVTVSEPTVLDRIELSGTYKTEFFQGDTYSNKGIVVTAYYKKGSVDVSSEDVTENTEFTGFDSSKVGDCTVTASYNGLTANYTVQIKAVPLGNVVNFDFTNYEYENGETVESVVNGDYSVNFFGPNSNKAAYYNTGTSIRVYSGNSFTIAGNKKIVEVEFTFGSGDTKNVNMFSADSGNVDATTGHWTNSNGVDAVTFTLNNVDPTSMSGHRRIKQIKVTYDESYDATKTLLSITLNGLQKTQFYKGDTFDYSDLEVTAHYSDFTSSVVTPTSITGYDTPLSKSGNIVVSYTEGGTTKTASYYIKVTPLSVVDIEFSGDYQTNFVIGQEFNHNGLVVTAINNSGSTFDATDRVTISKPDMSTTGTKVVTVTYKEGVYKTYEIFVDCIKPVSLEILTEPTKTSYVVGDDFSGKGIVVKATLNNGSKIDVSDKVTFSNYDMSVADTQTVIVSYADAGVTVKSTYEINVVALELSSIEIISEPTKTTYFVGEEFSISGLAVKAYYNNKTSKDLSFSDLIIDGYDTSKTGKQTVKVSYTDTLITKSDTFDIYVNPIEITSIKITGTHKTEYFVGDEFTSEGLIATAIYNYGDPEVITPTKIDGYDMSKSGEQTVKVYYGEIYGTYKINIYDIKLTGIALSGSYKTNYIVNEEFDASNLVVTATYNNGDTKIVSPTDINGYDMSKVGEQTVTVTYKDGEITKNATYKIVVNPVELDCITLYGFFRVTYYVGDELDISGIVVEASYTDGSTKIVTPTGVSGYNKYEVGQQTITISYQEGNITKSASYNIMVEELLPTRLSLSGDYKTEFVYGEKFDVSGLIVTAHYNSGSEKVVTPTSVTGYDMHKIGKQIITVSYEENGKIVQKTYEITVKIVLSDISISGTYKTEFEYGESFSSEGLIVTANYNDGTSKVVSPTSISGYNPVKEGYQAIRVSYIEDGIEKVLHYNIKVNKAAEPPKQESNLPVVIGAAAGGAVGIGVIITIICLVLKKKH